MPASSRWCELSAQVGSWIEAANGSNHDRVELLHDDGPLVRSFHDPLELGELVTGDQQEVRPIGTDLLVLVKCRRNSLGARGIRAFTRELGIAGVESLRAFGDSLVDVSEQRLGARYLHFAFGHRRLPSIDCQFDNGEGVKSVAPRCGLKR
jgi:hypothetical protein